MHACVTAVVGWGGCRKLTGQQAVVERLEYDPNRSAYLALIKYQGTSCLLRVPAVHQLLHMHRQAFMCSLAREGSSGSCSGGSRGSSGGGSSGCSDSDRRRGITGGIAEQQHLHSSSRSSKTLLAGHNHGPAEAHIMPWPGTTMGLLRLTSCLALQPPFAPVAAEHCCAGHAVLCCAVLCCGRLQLRQV